MILVALVFLPFYSCWNFLSRGYFSHLLIDSQSRAPLDGWCPDKIDRAATHVSETMDKTPTQLCIERNWPTFQLTLSSIQEALKFQVISFLAKKENGHTDVFMLTFPPRGSRDLCKPRFPSGRWESKQFRVSSLPHQTHAGWLPDSTDQSHHTFSPKTSGVPTACGLDQHLLVLGEAVGCN